MRFTARRTIDRQISSRAVISTRYQLLTSKGLPDSCCQRERGHHGLIAHEKKHPAIALQVRDKLDAQRSWSVGRIEKGQGSDVYIERNLYRGSVRGP